MKNLALILSMLLTSCGLEEVNVNGPEEVNVDEDGNITTSDKTKESEETTTTTTTTTTKKRSRERESIRYYVANENTSNTEFVSTNLCSGHSLGGCWIRSAYMEQISETEYKVSIEFWDSWEEKPYTIEKDIIDGRKSFLVTDAAYLDGDTGFDKMVWAVVDPEEKTMKLIYDWNKDGPQEQGDDLIETLFFILND